MTSSSSEDDMHPSNASSSPELLSLRALSLHNRRAYLQGMSGGYDYGDPNPGWRAHHSRRPKSKSASKNGDLPNGTKTDDKTEPEEPVDLSQLHVKFVDQTWDLKRHTWSSKDVDRSEIFKKEVKKNKKAVLVIRRQFGASGDLSENVKTFVDIKSSALLEVLRSILDSVKGINLRGKNPQLRLEILYSFLPELKSYYQNAIDKDDHGIKHLQKTIEFLEEWYASTTEELAQLLEHGEISYDLIWALFKPGTTIYTMDQDCEEPKCLVYDFGDQVKDHKMGNYFEMVCRSLHYDGQFFGEVQQYLKIPEFRGAKKITALQIYPMQYHPDSVGLKTTLVARGRKAISLMGVFHCEFKGLAFYRINDEAVKINVKGRTMIDAASFKEFNANYAKANIGDPSDPDYHLRRLDQTRRLATHVVKRKALVSEEITDDEAFLCGPTVQGFSLSKRLWAEFAVSGISDITWNLNAFDKLVVPAKKKDLLLALVKQTTVENVEDSSTRKAFDDFIEEKGQGLVILLHGSPGVGKTLTAEAISEYQKRPLYRVSAGDLDLDSTKLESKLSQILELATRWKAIVLLDEADVFVESRTLHNLHHNTLISIFLRSLEYFQGVMILTTNRVTVFDDAIKSRIHLGIKYDDLNQKARMAIWKTFIDRLESDTTVTDKQIRELSQRPSNGRMIKNCVRISYALAASKGEPLSYEHLTSALDANEDFDSEHRAIGLGANAVNSYL